METNKQNAKKIWSSLNLETKKRSDKIYCVIPPTRIKWENPNATHCLWSKL